MRICLAYDCLYPWTVGGAERWYRGLAEELAQAGHEVVYLTRLQWDQDSRPQLPGIRVVAVSPREPLYTDDGRRRIGETIRFGWGVLGHLLRNRRRYDAVHLCSFPFFSLLGARLALAGAGRRVLVDWFEVWTREYWTEYLGRVGGLVGWLVQRLCARLTPAAFVFSRVHEARLQEEGFRGTVSVLAGLYQGELEAAEEARPDEPLVVFAGRHIPEKRAHLVPSVVARAQQGVPGLRGLILGDGPERERVIGEIGDLGLQEQVQAPGFVDADAMRAALAQATCLLLPSVREGYGLVVIEAAALGTPSVVAQAPDNAAVELVTEGENGFVAVSPAVEDLAHAIVRVHDAGPELRRSTAAWFTRNADRLSVQGSLQSVLDSYAAPSNARR